MYEKHHIWNCTNCGLCWIDGINMEFYEQDVDRTTLNVLCSDTCMREYLKKQKEINI